MSLHYAGYAIDLRIWDFQHNTELLNRVVNTVRKRLGSQYDVVLKSDHIHIEFQPKYIV